MGVAFWGALAALAGLGIRYPLRMLPLLLLQLVYKSIWLIVAGLPLWSVGGSSDLMRAMMMGVVLDLIVIPWPYVFKTYVQAAGDRWRSEPRASAERRDSIA